ncbi:MAG: HD domain-containing protein [Lachnospiraceae bacterium]|nr:HD domain-containing protein [Lachnospiraceae bacterium]
MNREKLIQVFEQYVSDYDLNDPNIYLKYVHTGKVAENSECIARSLGLSETDIDLAWEIGMLHDIGRFEQLRRFDTFLDSISINHAEFGADLLFQEGLIEQFDEETKNRDLIEKAIRCHNLYRLPEGLTEREVLFCQVIRDADKVDIYRANYDTGLDVVYHVTKDELRNSLITPEVYEVFCEERAIPRTITKTVADHLVGHIALSFELVYQKSRELAAEQGYVWKLLDTTFDNPRTVDTMRKICDKIKNWYQENVPQEVTDCEKHID